MKMQLGATIARLRRARGLTQDQLAEAMHVSAPAVSKWETGQTYPDITLLAPLARFFGVSVDTLLSFEQMLDDEGRSAVVEDVRAAFAQGGWRKGIEAIRARTLEYPTDMMLRMELSGQLMECMVFAAEEADRREGKDLQVALLREAATATEGKTQWSARYILASFLLRDGKLDEAETLLSDFRDMPNGQTLMPTLRMLQGQSDEALREAQRNLLMAVQNVQSTLVTLTSLLVKKEEHTKATRAADISAALAELFGLSDSGLALMPAQAATIAASASGDDATLMDALERYVAAIKAPAPASTCFLFDALNTGGGEPFPERDAALQQMLRKDLEENPAYAAIRGWPRFQALLAGQEPSPTENGDT